MPKTTVRRAETPEAKRVRRRILTYRASVRAIVKRELASLRRYEQANPERPDLVENPEATLENWEAMARTTATWR